MRMLFTSTPLFGHFMPMVQWTESSVNGRRDAATTVSLPNRLRSAQR